MSWAMVIWLHLRIKIGTLSDRKLSFIYGRKVHNEQKTFYVDHHSNANIFVGPPACADSGKQICRVGFLASACVWENTHTWRWRPPVGAPLGGPCAPQRQPSSCPSAPPLCHLRPPSPVQDALAAAYELKTEDVEVRYILHTFFILSSPFSF